MKKVLLGLLVFFMLGATMQAQISSGMTAAKVDDLRSSKIVIINPTGQSIVFYLSCDGEDWQKMNMPADKYGEYECNYQSYVYIKMASNRSEVEYKLQSYNVYEIFFNSSRQLFDLQRR
jgi:hypothetical protein